LSNDAFDDPNAEIARLLCLLAENECSQEALDVADIVLVAEQGTLLRWISALYEYRERGAMGGDAA
jgi:hypothetical protein